MSSLCNMCLFHVPVLYSIITGATSSCLTVYVYIAEMTIEFTLTLISSEIYLFCLVNTQIFEWSEDLNIY